MTPVVRQLRALQETHLLYRVGHHLARDLGQHQPLEIRLVQRQQHAPTQAADGPRARDGMQQGDLAKHVALLHLRHGLRATRRVVAPHLKPARQHDEEPIPRLALAHHIASLGMLLGLHHRGHRRNILLRQLAEKDRLAQPLGDRRG